jgi:glutathione synthase/RimK-type ligase-like ATP-grasp enzyme
MPKIHVLHENDEWFAPLADALRAAHLPYESWHLAEGRLDLGETPPGGVFFSRMSASAHTRNHAHSPDYAAAVLAWLERHQRRVINGSAALRLEMSKVAQYMALEQFGFLVPHTVAVCGREQILAAAETFAGPFITKHNRSGKGLGVRLFPSASAVQAYIDGGEYAPPVDGILLLQAYIQSPQPFITRLEFVAGRFLYALRADASDGFELCPADSCSIGERCALDGQAKFAIVKEVFPGRERYEAMLEAYGVSVAGIEIIRDTQGAVYTYDINVNTNYNSAAEAKAGVSALSAVAAFLGEELKKA